MAPPATAPVHRAERRVSRSEEHPQPAARPTTMEMAAWATAPARLSLPSSAPAARAASRRRPAVDPGLRFYEVAHHRAHLGARPNFIDGGMAARIR